MCGRYTATQVNPALIADRFGVRERAVPAETLGRFNVCPTEPVLAVDAERAPRALRWGLIPPWARALRAGFLFLCPARSRHCEQPGCPMPCHYRVNANTAF